MTAARIVFWLAAGFLVYTFLGYQLAVWLLSLLVRRQLRQEPIRPRVSIIIAVHNAGELIAGKLENTLALDYPPELRQIMVASDGSDDDTVKIVRSFGPRGVEVLDLPHQGKHFAQHAATQSASGEIFVFTDGGVTLEPDALQMMVRNFADASVGAVTSEDDLEAGRMGLGERIYVKTEMWLRRREARLASLVGLSGSFFAARREVCQRWNPEQSSDFFVALNTVRAGLRAVVEPGACGRFGSVSRSRAEFHRKVRTIVHGLDVLLTNASLLNPFRYGWFAWQLASHKLFRWLLPFGLLALLLANIPLWNAGWFYRATLIAQASVYAAGVLGLVLPRQVRPKPLQLASYLLVGSMATLMAWVRFSMGEKFVTWKPSSRV